MRLWPNTVERVSFDWCMPSRYMNPHPILDTRPRAALVNGHARLHAFLAPDATFVVMEVRERDFERVDLECRQGSERHQRDRGHRRGEARDGLESGTTSRSAPASVTVDSASNVPGLPSHGISTKPAPAAPRMAPHTFTE